MSIYHIPVRRNLAEQLSSLVVPTWPWASSTVPSSRKDDSAGNITEPSIKEDIRFHHHKSAGEGIYKSGYISPVWSVWESIPFTSLTWSTSNSHTLLTYGESLEVLGKGLYSLEMLVKVRESELGTLLKRARLFSVFVFSSTILSLRWLEQRSNTFLSPAARIETLWFTSACITSVVAVLASRVNANKYTRATFNILKSDEAALMDLRPRNRRLKKLNFLSIPFRLSVLLFVVGLLDLCWIYVLALSPIVAGVVGIAVAWNLPTVVDEVCTISFKTQLAMRQGLGPRYAPQGMTIDMLIALRKSVSVPGLEGVTSTLADLLQAVIGNKRNRKSFGPLAQEAFALSYVLIRMCWEELNSPRYTALSASELESYIRAFTKTLEEITDIVKQRKTLCIIQRLEAWRRDPKLAKEYHEKLNAAVNRLQEESHRHCFEAEARFRKRFDAMFAARRQNGAII
ncbi:hypothetical protein AAF712_012895 [Marasmius tenuissimus]|uniref:Uncharacterized protein n=1 Tax=Marasmius tenuissimus TaxID=585030 RepID=A0ABR2ZHA1_9AGAR